MSNSSVILKALPSFWRDRFEDKDLLESMYSYLGEYLGDVYSQVYKSLSTLSIRSTPIVDSSNWKLVPLSSIHRLEIPSEGELGSSLVIYGIREQGYILNNCHRLYAAPSLNSEYLSSNIHFKFFDYESEEIADLINLTNNPAFFDRFSRFLVFTNVDPMSTFHSNEPDEPRAFYPLVFKLNTHLLGNLTESDITGSKVVIKVQDKNITTTVMVTSIDVNTCFIVVDPEAFTPFMDDSTVTISGLTNSAISASVHTDYSLSVTDLNIWAYDCEIDNLELYRRWGFLLRYDSYKQRPIRSTEQYKLLLEEMLSARLQGLSANRLERISSILAGSSELLFSSRNDTLLQVDLVDNKLLSSLTRYELLPNAPININILKSVLEIKTSQGVIPIQSCYFVSFSSPEITRIILKSYIQQRPLSIRFEYTDGTLLGRVLLIASNSSFLIKLDSGQILDNAALKVFYSTTEYVLVSSSYYQVESVTRLDSISDKTIVNPVAKVFDITNDIDSLTNSGLFLPIDIWNVSQGARREVTTMLTPFTIGEMPRHYIGDYEFNIPVNDNSVDYFDKITDLNPNGYSWPTAYKLYKDFLRTKVAIIKPLVPGLSFLNLDTVIETTKPLIDYSKRLIAANDVTITDFIGLPQDNIEVTVESPALQETTVAHSYEGIGSLGVTLLLKSSFNLQTSPTISLLRVTEVLPNNVVNPAAPYVQVVNLLGWGQDHILVDAGFSASFDYTGINLPNIVTEVYVNGSFVVVEQVDLVTNMVGSSSELMVVGASYPEHTSYYDFYPNTVAEWLQVEVTLPAPPSYLSEQPIQVTASLEQPQVIGPVVQNLQDTIDLPQDTLTDPDSEGAPGEYLDTIAAPTDTLAEEAIVPIESIVQDTADTGSATLNVEGIQPAEGSTTDSTDSPTDTLTIETI